MNTQQRIIRGLQILAKYKDSYISCEHDQIFSGPADLSLVSKDDAIELEDELGWFIDRESDSWSRYV